MIEARCLSLSAALRQHTNCEIRFDEGTRHLYSTDASIYRIEPLGVVMPRTAEDLRAVVQIALEMNIPFVPRGGGTSLSGQSIGAGLVVDCSKHLNRILDVDARGRRVRVQPGVVLDQLNRALAKDDLMFGPDVATANRANIGGMLGNNSAGSRSIVYGKTADHVLGLNVLLADGSAAVAEALPRERWENERLNRGVREIVERNADEIRRRFPNIIRRVSGYNLQGMLDQLDKKPSLIPLLVGSEGTLAFVTEAELNLVPKPRSRGLLIPHFKSLRTALDAVQVCLEFQPSAVELLDGMLIELAAGNLALRDVMKHIDGRPAALLMVEISGDSPAEIASRIDSLNQKLKRGPGLTGVRVALDAELRDPLWNLRSAAVPLLLGMHGDRKPVTFCEDTAVSPERLPEFADRFRELLKRHGTGGAFYGHASVGCLHVRPLLNLKDPGDVIRMRQIMHDVTDLVLEFGGSLSGEHGDGLARSEWNRKMYGPQIYSAFQQIKGLFDPKNVFNPGKIVDAPTMTENLRTSSVSSKVELPTVFDYSRQEGFFRSIELCNGSGVCRKTQGGTMCPSFRATRDEVDSTRGRANALRIALEQGVDRPDPAHPMAERWVYDVMDLCLMCKACKAECPSNVDMQKLKSEFLHSYYQRQPRPIGQRVMAYVHRFNRLGSKYAGLANWFHRLPGMRVVIEKLAGIDRRRSLPTFHADDFRSWFDRRTPRRGANGAVHLLDDCFTTFNEPHIAKAAVKVFESAGYQVKRLGMVCCGRAMISKGMLDEARSLVRSQLPRLNALVADGTPILGLEPSCLLTLCDEWPDLMPGAAATRVAKAAHLAEVWLGEQIVGGRAKLPFKGRNEQILFQGHCHQKALCGSHGSAAAMSLVPNVNVQTIDAGCCGMAGSFGYEVEHYDVSVQIANLELVPAIKANPAATLAATGTSCRHQIRDLTGRSAKHPMEVLADAIVAS